MFGHVQCRKHFIDAAIVEQNPYIHEVCVEIHEKRNAQDDDKYFHPFEIAEKAIFQKKEVSSDRYEDENEKDIYENDSFEANAKFNRMVKKGDDGGSSNGPPK